MIFPSVLPRINRSSCVVSDENAGALVMMGLNVRLSNSWIVLLESVCDSVSVLCREMRTQWCFVYGVVVCSCVCVVDLC